MNFGENVCFWNGNAICQNLGSEGVGVSTGIVDLLICNTRNEDSLIMKNEAGIATCNSRLLKLSKVQFCSEIEVNQYIKYTYLYQRYIRTESQNSRIHALIYSIPSDSQKSRVKSHEDYKSRKPGTNSKKYRPPTLPPALPHQAMPHPNPQAPSTQRRTRQCQRGRGNSPVQLLRGIGRVGLPNRIRVFFEWAWGGGEGGSGRTWVGGITGVREAGRAGSREE